MALSILNPVSVSYFNFHQFSIIVKSSDMMCVTIDRFRQTSVLFPIEVCSGGET